MSMALNLAGVDKIVKEVLKALDGPTTMSLRTEEGDKTVKTKVKHTIKNFKPLTHKDILVSQAKKKRFKAMTKARELGLRCIFAPKGHLFVDLDVPFETAALNETIMELLEEWYGVKGTLKTRSKSGNAHFYVKLGSNSGLKYQQKLLLQAALGSDPKHEALGMIKQNGFSALFETQEEAKRVSKFLKQIDLEDERC